LIENGGVEVTSNDNVVVQGGSVGYKMNEPLLSDVVFSFNPGEIIAINGASGIGKTTLLKTLAGLLEPLKGEFSVFGKSKPRRGEVGYIPQRLGLIRHASVLHNVMLGARAGHTSAWFPFSPHCRKFSNDAIESVGIYHKLRTPVRKLSGGQQRRVAVARTLAQQPRLILADEFLAELDEETLEMVMKVVLDYVAENNAIMILVEHDFERAKRMASRLFTAQDGTLVEIYDF
tara:strand:+ start:140 stop:835 length:696 start_codon:yes stop_codon:yes gene_type:complete